VDAALRLTDEPSIITGAQGVALIDRTTLGTMMKSPAYTLNQFLLKDGAHVRLLTNDVAIVAYTVHEELTVDGKPVTLDAADSSTWVRREGRWICALPTEAIAEDPFGRDRQQTI
jgi:hypothetical protein